MLTRLRVSGLITVTMEKLKTRERTGADGRCGCNFHRIYIHFDRGLARSGDKDKETGVVLQCCATLQYTACFVLDAFQENALYTTAFNATASRNDTTPQQTHMHATGLLSASRLRTECHPQKNCKTSMLSFKMHGCNHATLTALKCSCAMQVAPPLCLIASHKTIGHL